MQELPTLEDYQGWQDRLRACRQQMRKDHQEWIEQLVELGQDIDRKALDPDLIEKSGDLQEFVHAYARAVPGDEDRAYALAQDSVVKLGGALQVWLTKFEET